MLHIIKQIKGGFMGFISLNLMNGSEANRVADIVDSSGDEKITLTELHDALVNKNKELSGKKRDLVKDIYNKINGKQNSIEKQEFINLLTGQEKERKGVDFKYDSKRASAKEIISTATNNVKNKTQITIESQNNRENLNVSSILNKRYGKEQNGAEMKLLQKTLNKYLNIKLTEEGSWGTNTKNALLTARKKLGENSSNKETNSNSVEKSLDEKDRAIKTILDFDKKIHSKTDVIELQKALIKMGHTLKGRNGGIDGSFGGSTKRAYESALATSKHIENLNAVSDFTEAYSNQYGATDKIFNPKDGVIGQVLKYTTDSDASDLKNKLGFNYNNLDKKLVKNFAEELGIKKDSPEYDKYLKKTLIDAGISALVSYLQSGGDNISALIRVTGFNPHAIAKLFGVNDISVIYKKAPTTKQILDTLFGKGHNYKDDAKDAYINGMKTKEEISEVTRASLGVDINSLKRNVREIKGYLNLSGIPIIGTLLNTLKDLVGDEFDGQIRKLEKIYKQKGNINPEYVDDIMGVIGKKILEPLKEEIAKGGNDAIKAQNAYNELASIIGRHNNIEKKYYKEFGVTEKAKQEIIKDENAADKQLRELGYKNPTKNKEKLHSKLSYGFNIEKSINKYGKEGYVKRLAETLSQDGKHSMLSKVAATLTEKTTGLSFSMPDLINGMKDIKKVTKLNEKEVKILSNLGVDQKAEFQGSLGKGTLYKISLNGADVYFKGECNNPIMVVNKLNGTTLSAESQGLHIKVNLKETPVKEDTDPTPDPDPTTPTTPTTTPGVVTGNPATNGSGTPTVDTPVVTNTTGTNVEVAGGSTLDPAR